MVSTAIKPNSTENNPYPLAKLAYQHYGSKDNPALLILHGWGSSALAMKPMAEQLASAFSVFNLDLPGHGNSPVPARSFGIPTHANLVDRFINEIIGKSVFLVGHSNGGRIGLYMASTENLKPLIRRMALISPSGITPRRGPVYYLKTWTSKILKSPFVALPEPFRGYGLNWVRGTFLWQMLGSSDYKAVTGTMRDLFTETVSFFVDDQVGAISCPVLLLWGTQDTAISRHQIDVLTKEISDIDLVTLDGAGHYGFRDQPENVIESILRFAEVTK